MKSNIEPSFMCALKENINLISLFTVFLIYDPKRTMPSCLIEVFRKCKATYK